MEKETERGALVKNKVKVFEEAEAHARLFMQRRAAELARLDPKLAELAEQNADSIIIDSISGRDGRHGD